MPIETRRQQLMRFIDHATRRFREDLKFPYKIFIDGHVVHECAARASITLLEYNMTGDAIGVGEFEEHELPNHFKEAGHYAYWVARLKPIRTLDRTHIATPLEAGHIKHDGGQLKTYMQEGHRPDFLLNEYAALVIGKLLVSSVEKELLTEKVKSLPRAEATALQAAFEAARTRILGRTNALSPHLLRSFRYDVHSANTIALLFETLLGSGLVGGDA
jgi:hypothetical protein